MRRLATYLAWIAACESAGLLAALATAPQVSAWYAGLAKPPWTPPEWLFGPVWTALYALMGVAAARVWIRHRGTQTGQRSLAAFVLQLVLNAAWSFLFFGLHSPALGFVDILALWGLIVTLVLWWWRLERPSSLLLVPYLAWVSFAAALNAAVWQLNP